jgi:hypothetical protein
MGRHFIALLLLLLLLLLLATIACASVAAAPSAAAASTAPPGRRSFTIANDSFLLDGQPFQLISGAIHYFRVHPTYWKDRLARSAALGLNAVEVYVPWNTHEPYPGQYVWEGGADLERFIGLAQEMNLLVLVRAGEDTREKNVISFADLPPACLSAASACSPRSPVSSCCLFQGPTSAPSGSLAGSPGG